MQRFAGVYKKVVFLHFYAESNEMTKYLDEVKLKVERHPHFAFFRNGKRFKLLTVCRILLCSLEHSVYASTAFADPCPMHTCDTQTVLVPFMSFLEHLTQIVPAPFMSFSERLTPFATLQWCMPVFIHFHSSVGVSQESNVHLCSIGRQEFWFTGANAENFESYIQQQTTAEENPATGLSMFARRAHRAKVGLTRS